MKRGTPEHPKTTRLARTLRVGRAQAVGTLEVLWHWCARYAQQGDVGKFANCEIAAGAYWAGDPDKLIDALVECGWLEVHATHRLIVHDWHEHADDAVKKWLSRHGLKFLSCPDNVGTESGQCPDSGSLPKPKPKPKPLPDTSTNVDVCSEPPSATAEPPVLLFPVVGKDTSEWGLSPTLLKTFVESYPGVDVLAECKAAKAWCVANSTKRKTPRGMPAFLNRWLAKAQDSGRQSGNGRTASNPRKPFRIADIEDLPDEQD